MSEGNEDFEWDSDDEATTGDIAPSSEPLACPPGEVVLSSPWRSGLSNLALVSCDSFLNTRIFICLEHYCRKGVVK